jgi:hypothetical protein
MTRRLNNQSKVARAASAIQLVDSPHNPAQLLLRRVRRWDRVVARFLASSLDSQLAAGRSPESTHRSATRAQQLTSPTMRQELARNWDHLLDVTNRTPVARSPRAPLLRESIKDTEADLREMLTKLATPLPVSARGVAMVRVLLTDGTGPLFNPHCSTDLRTAIQDATAHLDPVAALRPNTDLPSQRHSRSR